MDRKILFFDIDGTIWDRFNFIPESTRETMKKLKENGHLIFINSGRGRGFIFNENLLSLDFDGIVSGCGTRIEYHGDVLYYYDPGIDMLRWALDICREYSFAPILEGYECLYMHPEEFPNDLYVQKLQRELGGRLKRIDEYDGRWNASKFSISCDVPNKDEGLAKLEKHFSVIAHNPGVAEIVPLGHDKGTAIARVCEYLGADIKDTFAFGDSRNDLQMLKAAGVSVCMGDGYDCAKEIADYVTDDLLKDGIKKACVHYGLI